MEGLWAPLSSILTANTPSSATSSDKVTSKFLSVNLTDTAMSRRNSEAFSHQKQEIDREGAITVAPTTQHMLDPESSLSSSATDGPSSSIVDHTKQEEESLHLSVNHLVLSSPSKAKFALRTLPDDIISFVKDLKTPSLEASTLKLPNIPAPFLEARITGAQVPIAIASVFHCTLYSATL